MPNKMSATKRQQQRHEERARHLKKLERQFQEAVLSSVSLMSDTKWRKALMVVANSHCNLSGTAWKFLNEGRIAIEDSVPQAGEILDSHLSDATFYYVSYKHIEWLDVLTDQPDLLLSELNAIGRFELACMPDRLRLYGYKPMRH